MAGDKAYIPASQKIPVLARPFVSERAKKTLDLVRLPNLGVFRQY